MADLLFWLAILSAVGMLVIPLSHPSRGAAVFGWFIQWLAAGVFKGLRREYFPSWQEPEWSYGLVWVLATWLFFIVGFIIAIRKPRKRDIIVA